MYERDTMNELINQLLDYGLENGMIKEVDVDYSANLLLDLFHLDYFERKECPKESIYTILDKMLAYAVENNMISDSITEKDLFDTRIMNCIMPRPSEVVKHFNDLYKEDPKKATDYFYKLSIDSNYIRKSRIDKNIEFHHEYKYGDFQITINLSKPEKDPKEIAEAKTIKSSGYPKCLLCKENVGFAGNMNHPARETHRIILLELSGKRYNMQYSPYVYYNEHCIIFNDNHVPMVVNKESFEHLLSFIEQFPHYILGSNADLPIVGGSILTHDHYQGGRHVFPMDNAKVVKEFNLKNYTDVNVEMLHWPLSTIRITSNNKEQLLELATNTLEKWIDYSDEELGIISHTNGERHNTITPISRMKDGAYQMDLVLRNNRTDDENPLGIFHPHSEHHHIKKENIGLIEVMGLAILPGRLKTELEELKQCLKGEAHIEDYPELEKHKEWFNYLKTLEYNDIDEMMEIELTKKFVQVLEDAGVYKMDDAGIAGFTKFIESLDQ